MLFRVWALKAPWLEKRILGHQDERRNGIWTNGGGVGKPRKAIRSPVFRIITRQGLTGFKSIPWATYSILIERSIDEAETSINMVGKVTLGKNYCGA